MPLGARRDLDDVHAQLIMAEDDEMTVVALQRGTVFPLEERDSEAIHGLPQLGRPVDLGVIGLRAAGLAAVEQPLERVLGVGGE